MAEDREPKLYQGRNRTTSCTECKGEVRVRRPSRSGEHYCAKPECQAAKQRSYRQRRATEQARIKELNLNIAEGNLLTIVGRIAAGQPASKDPRESYIIEAMFAAAAGRQPCASCGREDAVAGLPHPTIDLQDLCRELQLTAPPQGLSGPVTYAIWPEMLVAVQAKLAAERAAMLAAREEAGA